MSIRFDKDSRRATNGPMIFFSDPSAEISLGEEIRGAIKSRLSFYAYRRPDDMMISFGSSESLAEGIGTPGFVIAPFHPSLPYLTIPYKPTTKNAKQTTDNQPLSTNHQQPTSLNQYLSEIQAIKAALKEIGSGKVVAARLIVEDRKIDPAASFARLCHEYPTAFVFCFATPYTGCWIGASPELLLESNKGTLSTMALAGTMPADSWENWDIKNIEEQRMVTNFIMDALAVNDLKPNIDDTFEKYAGPVKHICTTISAQTGNEFDVARLNQLLRTLSPTPALCGLPRDLALRVISENEFFNRECYGGFCGPYHGPEDFNFFVNLRSARVEENRVAMFAGGGITLLSDPDKEWEETNLKAQTMAKCLVNS